MHNAKKFIEESKLRQFDPDLSPSSDSNREAARDRGLKYDSKQQVYRDADGCPVRDRFGQELG